MNKENRHNFTGDFQREAKELLTSKEINLSDFALFLSVMRHKKAYQNVLSIIMEEQELRLVQVHVEEVILNKSGKRAIRLDARAWDEKGRSFAAEMQNDTSQDDMRRRARYYQSLLDTPILLAKYTFREQCEEVKDLYLEDGTTKIFLNMKSKNGRPELISLLQYMKKTTLENPEILVQDERIVELDAIVREVKESDEWEEAQMSILSVGIEKGRQEGMEQGLEKGRREGIEAAKKAIRLSAQGVEPEEIAKLLGISLENVMQIIE